MAPHGLRENNVGASIILFVVFAALFFGGIFFLSYGTVENAWPFVIGILASSLGLAVPLTFIGRSDTSHDPNRH